MKTHLSVGFSLAVRATAVGCAKVSLHSAIKDVAKGLNHWDKALGQSKSCLYISQITIESDASRDFTSPRSPDHLPAIGEGCWGADHPCHGLQAYPPGPGWCGGRVMPRHGK